MRNIKVIRDELNNLRTEYEARVAELNAEIDAVRKSRGTKLKAPDWSGHHDFGRDCDPGVDMY